MIAQDISTRPSRSSILRYRYCLRSYCHSSRSIYRVEPYEELEQKTCGSASQKTKVFFSASPIFYGGDEAAHETEP